MTAAAAGPETEMVAELPLAGMPAAVRVEATTPVIAMGIVVVDGFEEILKVATAIVPGAKGLLLKPTNKHAFTEQETNFCAFVADGPVNTITLAMSGV